jgi:hypothetical protein
MLKQNKKREKNERRRESNLQPLSTLLENIEAADVNGSKENVFIAIFLTNGKIRTSVGCFIFRHNKHSDF